MATYHAYYSVQHEHTKNVDSFGKKPRYTGNRVPLTKNSLQAPLVALNYSVEYFHGKYWPVSGELQLKSVPLSTSHCTSIMEFKTVLDSGFHAVDSRFQVLDSNLCQWNLDSGFQSLVEFRIP